MNAEEIKFVSNGDYLDTEIEDGIYTYRIVACDTLNPTDEDFKYSNWIKCNINEPVGYSFGNFERSGDNWGVALTPDDLRYTYLWGTDFKATNGAIFSDEQINFFIKASLEEIERQLNISIVKKRIVCNPIEKNLKKNVDYDAEEDLYNFSWKQIAKYGTITTRNRPILKVNNINLLNRVVESIDLSNSIIVDKQKGVIKFLQRPVKPSLTSFGISQSIGMFGSDTYNCHLFYDIDYTVGYENSDEIPSDLREIIAKQAAVSLLNIIGDGLMSGFSSSSLSMDGISESFSSTQSATSAYFGARIKEYKDDINDYIKENKNKFASMPISSL